jgi:hypothetical protein
MRCNDKTVAKSPWGEGLATPGPHSSRLFATVSP